MECFARQKLKKYRTENSPKKAPNRQRRKKEKSPEKNAPISEQKSPKFCRKSAKNQSEINPKSRLKTAEKKNRQNVRNVKIINAFSPLKNKKYHCFAVKKAPKKFCPQFAELKTDF